MCEMGMRYLPISNDPGGLYAQDSSPGTSPEMHMRCGRFRDGQGHN